MACNAVVTSFGQMDCNVNWEAKCTGYMQALLLTVGSAYILLNK